MSIIKDLRAHRTIYDIAQKNQKYQIDLELHKIKLDWIGRPYIQFPVPTEFWDNGETLNGFILNKVNMTINPILNRYHIDTMVSMQTLLDHKERSVLLIFKPSHNLIRRIIVALVFWSIAIPLVWYAITHLITYFRLLWGN